MVPADQLTFGLLSIPIPRRRNVYKHLLIVRSVLAVLAIVFRQENRYESQFNIHQIVHAMAAYNDYERKTLVDLVRPHRSVIDSKRVDADTLSKKREIWLNITNEYNQHTRVRKRLTKQLRRLWENTKARWKKEAGSTSARSSIAHVLLNESKHDEQMMETIQVENNRDSDQTSDSDKAFDVHDVSTARMLNARGIRPQPKNARQRLEDDKSSATSLLDEDQMSGVADVLAPGKVFALESLVLAEPDRLLTHRASYFVVIAARVRRNDEAIEQQRELHQLAVQRERLQIKVLEEQLAKQAEAHTLKLEREREVRKRDPNQLLELEPKTKFLNFELPLIFSAP